MGKRKNGNTTDEQEAVEKKSKKGKINSNSGQEKDDMQKKNGKKADKSACKSADDAKADKKQSKTSGSKPNHEKKSKETKAKKSEVDVEAFPELQVQLCGWIHNNFTSYDTLETVKEQCAAARGKYEYCRLNIYWHTFTCGLTMKKIGESKSYDIARFNIEKSLRGLVVAIACAEHMAWNIDDSEAPTIEVFDADADEWKKSLQCAGEAIVFQDWV